MKRHHVVFGSLAGVSLTLAMMAMLSAKPKAKSPSQFLGNADQNAQQMVSQGRQTFRFDTYGDQAFWGGQLHMQQPINALKPSDALTLGLKVDADALSPSTVNHIKHGQVDLGD